MKPLNGMHEDRFPSHNSKLLGDVASHPKSFATCYNDDKSHLVGGRGDEVTSGRGVAWMCIRVHEWTSE